MISGWVGVAKLEIICISSAIVIARELKTTEAIYIFLIVGAHRDAPA